MAQNTPDLRSCRGSRDVPAPTRLLWVLSLPDVQSPTTPTTSVTSPVSRLRGSARDAPGLRHILVGSSLWCSRVEFTCVAVCQVLVVDPHPASRRTTPGMTMIWQAQLPSRVRQDVESRGPRSSPTKRPAFWRKQLQGVAFRERFHLSMNIKAQIEYFFAHHSMVCVGCSSIGSSGRDFASFSVPANRLREKQSAKWMSASAFPLRAVLADCRSHSVRLTRSTRHAYVVQTWPPFGLHAESDRQP